MAVTQHMPKFLGFPHLTNLLHCRVVIIFVITVVVVASSLSLLLLSSCHCHCHCLVIIAVMSLSSFSLLLLSLHRHCHHCIVVVVVTSILPFGVHGGARPRVSAGGSSSVTWDAERIWAGGTHFLWMQMGGQVSTARVLDQGQACRWVV